MGFANRGWKSLPRTYAACQKEWEDRHRAVARNGYATLANNTKLYWREYDGGYFYAEFHGHRIVIYYPEFKVIDACGFENSPTTQDRIGRLTGVRIGSNARLGFDQPVRVNGYPYFSGMRIDNFGNVFEEDRRPDTKEVTVKEVVNRYTTLWKRIYKHLIARYEIGEFDREDYDHSWKEERAQRALLACEEILMGGANDGYIPKNVAMDLLHGAKQIYSTELKPLLDYRKDGLREWWMRRNNGYETIEVK